MTKETIDIPDGKGGFKQVEAERQEGQTANTTKQQKELEEKSQEAHFERVGAAAESFNKMHKAYATDYNLSEEELVKAMYLEILNWKFSYPDELGGVERFDSLCQEAFAWYEKNK